MEFAADYFKICGKCGALLLISSIDFKSIVFKLNLKVENFIFFIFSSRAVLLYVGTLTFEL